jgi:hypothetical protein
MTHCVKIGRRDCSDVFAFLNPAPHINLARDDLSGPSSRRRLLLWARRPPPAEVQTIQSERAAPALPASAFHTHTNTLAATHNEYCCPLNSIVSRPSARLLRERRAISCPSSCRQPGRRRLANVSPACLPANMANVNKRLRLQIAARLLTSECDAEVPQLVLFRGRHREHCQWARVSSPKPARTRLAGRPRQRV